METAINAVNVIKIYGRSSIPALDRISLSVEPGKIFTLLGRNGAGKTTFVRICATQLLPTAGTVQVLGYDVSSQPKKIRELISIVPQEGRPLRALTPWDHVYNWLQIRGIGSSEAKERTAQILQKLELYEVKDKPAMYLSGGMKQKILVAMAMATDAKLLFLDEPTIGLDPISRRQVWSAVNDWKKDGRTVLLTTHYMDEAEVLSDHIVIVDKGKIVADGTLGELRKTIPQNTRVDIAKGEMSIETLSSFGSVVDTGAGLLRIFTFENAAKEISEMAIRKNMSITISPVTLDDVFVHLVGSAAD
jgi:ABC-2 type transport system ATP-binding protein